VAGVVNRCDHIGSRRGEEHQCVLPAGHGVPLHQYGALAKVSGKRQQQNYEYLKLRDTYLADHPQCMFPLGCHRKANVVHHMRGRQGARLLDQSWWAASCVPHNDYAETNTGEALAIGWLFRVEGAA
jgi:hypothetical protein